MNTSKLPLCIVAAVLFSLQLLLAGNNDAMLDLARDHFNKREYTEAKAKCRTILINSPTYYKAYMFLGEIENKLKNKEGEFRECAAAFEILQQKPELSEEEKADYALLDEKLDKLNSNRVKVKGYRSNFIEELLVLAKEKMEQEDWVLALKALEYALKSDPKNEDVLALVAVCLNPDLRTSGGQSALFNGVDLENWEAEEERTGAWKVNEKAIHGEEDRVSKAPFFMFSTSVVEQDFIFTVEVKLQDGYRWGSVGALALRTQNKSTHIIRFELSERQILMKSTPKPDKEGGIVTSRPLGMVSLATPLTIGEWNTLTLKKEGNNLSLEYKGIVQLNQEIGGGGDEALGTLEVGLGLIKGGILFQNIQLKPLETESSE